MKTPAASCELPECLWQAVEACSKAEEVAQEGCEPSTCLSFLNMRALAYEQLEMFALGVADYEHALRVDPAHRMVRLLFAWLELCILLGDCLR